MRAPTRALIAAAVVGGALAVVPAAHATVTWTVVPTGVTEDITAVAYTPTKVIFAAGAKLYAGPPTGPFAQQADYTAGGAYFTDIAISPDGQHALAVGSADGAAAVYQSDTAAGTWGYANVTSWDTNDVDGTPAGEVAGLGDCGNGVGYVEAERPTKPLTGVAWTSNTLAYAVGQDEGVVLEGGYGVDFVDVNRNATGLCAKIDNQVLDDVVAVPGAPGNLWFVAKSFGGLWHTTNGLNTPASPGPEIINNYVGRSSITLDPTNPSHISAVNDDPPGGLNWGYTGDAGISNHYVAPAAGASITPPLRSIASYGGSFIAVGDGGAILRSINGATPEAIGDGTTTQWNDVEMISASQALVVGSGGRMVITAEAADPAGPETPPGGGGGTTTGNPLSPDGSVPVVGGAAVATRSSVIVKVKGKLGLPAGVSAKAGCKGVVKLTLKKGGKTLAKASAKVKKSCVYKKQIRVPRSKVGNAKLLRLNLVLTKNKALGRVKAAYPVAIRQK